MAAALRTLETTAVAASPLTAGEAQLRATLGIRTGHHTTVTFGDFCTSTGLTPLFFRHVLGWTELDTPGEFLREASGNAWALFVPSDDPRYGFFHKHPQTIGSITFPNNSRFKANPDVPNSGNNTDAERTKRLQDVVAGVHDATFDRIFGYIAQDTSGRVHRFCVNSESDNFAVLPERKNGIDPELWRAAFHYVAARVHAAGHLVVYNGNGPWYELDRSRWSDVVGVCRARPVHV